MFCHSDGVWDPEKWYALHLHPVRSPLHEGLKRDDKTDDRPTLKRRIQGKFPHHPSGMYQFGFPTIFYLCGL